MLLYIYVLLFSERNRKSEENFRIFAAFFQFWRHHPWSASISCTDCSYGKYHI